jgi:hypothetical protein
MPLALLGTAAFSIWGRSTKAAGKRALEDQNDGEAQN